MSSSSKAKKLKAFGAVYAKNVGWFLPDPEFGCVGNIGKNADEAFETLRSEDIDKIFNYLARRADSRMRQAYLAEDEEV